MILYFIAGAVYLYLSLTLCLIFLPYMRKAKNLSAVQAILGSIISGLIWPIIFLVMLLMFSYRYGKIIAEDGEKK